MSAAVLRVHRAIRPDVPRAEVALGVVLRQFLPRNRLRTAEPRPKGPTLGHEDPFVRQRVVSTMRSVEDAVVTAIDHPSIT